MADGGTSRPTAKFDPKELLGLVALTKGKERLRPTCEMPKLELANLLHDPAIGRATPLPVGVITEDTCMIVTPQPTPEPVQLAKGSSGIAPIPKQVIEAARLADEEAASKHARQIHEQTAADRVRERRAQGRKRSARRAFVIAATCVATLGAVAVSAAAGFLPMP